MPQDDPLPNYTGRRWRARFEAVFDVTVDEDDFAEDDTIQADWTEAELDRRAQAMARELFEDMGMVQATTTDLVTFERLRR